MSKLRGLLISIDFGSLILAAAVVESIDERRIGVATVFIHAFGAFIALSVLALEKLYRTRKCALGANEATGIAHACLSAALFEMTVAGLRSDAVAARKVVVIYLLGMVTVWLGRRWYRNFVNRARRHGRYLRPVVIVGSGDEVGELASAARDPENGYWVVGLIGPEDDAARHGLTHIGPLDTADAMASLVARTEALGAIVCATALDHLARNDLVRILLDEKLHVQVTCGLTGFAPNRLLPAALGDESLYYVESTPSLGGGQAAAKRVVDTVLATVALVLLSPVIFALGLLVRRDGGPAIFRQRRVGRDGREFTMYKLRTMVVNAEAQLPGLVAANERSGPLFKVTDDPRFTRIGRIMDAASLNELPQLWNVLRGDMSLVGPRPALAREVALFDARVQRRHRVRPGITGLWQVEARDSPDFSAYARHDIFYVENWSIGMDLAILWRTGTVVLRRMRSLVRRNRPAVRPADPGEVAVALPAGTVVPPTTPDVAGEGTEEPGPKSSDLTHA